MCYQKKKLYVIINAMKRCLTVVLILTLAILSASASVDMRSAFSTPADNGSYEAVFSNPAALPWRNQDGKDFLIGVRYRDDYSKSLFASDSPYRFLQSVVSDVTLSFSGRTMAFTAVFENSLDRTGYQDKPGHVDLFSTTYFQLDMGYSLWRFSGGIRVSGGNMLIRQDRSVVNIFDYLQNSFLTKFENYDGGEFFSVGIGLQYRDEIFSLGFYSDRVLYLNESGSATSSLDGFLSSLSIGAKATAHRFTGNGELLLIRPSASVLFSDIAGEDSRVALSASLIFQLLPDADLTLSAGYMDTRNMKSESYFIPNTRYALFSLLYSMSGYSIGLDFTVPFTYFAQSDSDKPMKVDLFFRVRI